MTARHSHRAIRTGRTCLVAGSEAVSAAPHTSWLFLRRNCSLVIGIEIFFASFLLRCSTPTVSQVVVKFVLMAK